MRSLAAFEAINRLDWIPISLLATRAYEPWFLRCGMGLSASTF